MKLTDLSKHLHWITKPVITLNETREESKKERK